MNKAQQTEIDDLAGDVRRLGDKLMVTLQAQINAMSPHLELIDRANDLKDIKHALAGVLSRAYNVKRSHHDQRNQPPSIA